MQLVVLETQLPLMEMVVMEVEVPQIIVEPQTLVEVEVLEIIFLEVLVL